MIDKRLLTDSVTIQKVTDRDTYGKATYDPAIELSPVKFDRNFSHQGTGSHRSESKPSVLLVYPQFTPVTLDKSYNGGKMICDGEEFIIRQVIPQKHPFTKKVLCYEIEVV